jgi:pimeloyl-ACP methyl ester carboxylesterase
MTPGLFAGEPPARFASLLVEMTAAVRPASLMRQLSAMAETDQRDVLAAITVPTLLIWGDADTRSPLTVARQFADAVPGAQLVLLAGAGHVSNLEQPRPFTNALRSFCRGHPAPAD